MLKWVRPDEVESIADFKKKYIAPIEKGGCQTEQRLKLCTSCSLSITLLSFVAPIEKGAKEGEWELET